jgi:hypothetical protein
MTQLNLKNKDLMGKVGYLAAMSDSNPDNWQFQRWAYGEWKDFSRWKYYSHEILSNDTAQWRKKFVEVAKAEPVADRIAELESVVKELKQLWKDEMTRASRARYALEIASGFFGNSCVDDIRKMIYKALEETKPT